MLALEPGNVHALANLVRFSFLCGRIQEAETHADALERSEAYAYARWEKVAEAYSWLGRDEAVDRAFARAKQEGRLTANLLHLAGVAAARLGDAQGARKRWKKAVKEGGAAASRAAENLAELRRPWSERKGPWAFPLEEWISRQQMSAMKAAGNAHRTLQRLPELEILAPHMLDRAPETLLELKNNRRAVSTRGKDVDPVGAGIMGHDFGANKK